MSAIYEFCKCNNDSVSVFCKECGSIISKDNSKEYDINLLENMQKECKEYARYTQDSIKNITFASPLPSLDNEFSKFAKIKKLLEIYKNKLQENEMINYHINEITKFLQRDNTFQIAFVGLIKAGKSTLINAMLKQNYASMKVEPETAALTKFKYEIFEKYFRR
ncbi:hypothetical protein DCO59_02635 [Helicobacter saguini]|uniref:dynamin family protein n=1 Tax=Helicobacter saguini TaxID=1548018 RepID=UPI00136D543E|nr:dynamin family protein [Helicobacter saguini]MWV71286.1 hypothetical protein [Helicobacter saguini]